MLRLRFHSLGLLTLAALSLLCACRKDEPQRPNVLLITIDTLRADRIDLEHGGQAVMPNLRALARESLQYPSALAPRAKTTPAIASLLTGLYPHEHGVRELLQPIKTSTPMLQERLREKGWHTAAIIGNFVLKDQYSGLSRGFETWREDLPDTQGVPPENVPQRRAASLTDAALEELAKPKGSRPWMLWLHYMDPHGVYDAPDEHRVFAPSAVDPINEDPAQEPKPYIAQYNVPQQARLADGRIDAAAVRALYDAEARYVDTQLARIFEWLRANGQYENTILIVTADHGESLGEHNYWFEHGRNAYEANSAVPLIIRAPDMRPGRGSPDVSLCDLAPSLLSHLSLDPLLPPPDERLTRGEIVPGLYSDGKLPSRAVFTEKIERSGEERVVQHKAVRMGTWKRVRRFTTLEGQLRIVGEELYDLQADPRETRNLMNDPPADAPLARLDAELLRFARADVQFADLARKLEEQRERLEREDPGAARVLKALGY